MLMVMLDHLAASHQRIVHNQEVLMSDVLFLSFLLGMPSIHALMVPLTTPPKSPPNYLGPSQGWAFIISKNGF